jgi:hypothetical protein
MTNIRRSLTATPLVLLGTAGHALAQSCAMCAASFGPNDPTSRAMSWSILFLMAAPYTIVFTVAGVLFYLHRRGPDRRRAAIIDLAKAARLLRHPATVAGHQGDTP